MTREDRDAIMKDVSTEDLLKVLIKRSANDAYHFSRFLVNRIRGRLAEDIKARLDIYRSTVGSDLIHRNQVKKLIDKALELEPPTHEQIKKLIDRADEQWTQGDNLRGG